MSVPKILVLLVLIIIVTIFILGTGLGFLQPDNGKGAASFNIKNHPALKGLGSWLPSPRSAEFQAAGAGCPGHAGKPLASGDLLSIAPSTACGLAVPAAGRRFLVIPAPQSQSVMLQVTAGTVQFTPLPGDDLNKNANSDKIDPWPAGNQVRTLIVHGVGGQLMLSCLAGATCGLRVM
jgi:hypothetical protein